MSYPDREEVMKASLAQLWEWYKKVKEPITDEEYEIYDLIDLRIMQLTGRSPSHAR